MALRKKSLLFQMKMNNLIISQAIIKAGCTSVSSHAGVWGFGALLKSLTSVMVLTVEEIAGYSLQNLNDLINETV